MNLTGRRRPDPTSRSSGRAEAQRSRPQLRPRCKTEAAAAITSITAPAVSRVPPRPRDQGSPRHGDHGRHGGHGDEGGDAPAVLTAITAPTAAHAPRGA